MLINVLVVLLDALREKKLLFYNVVQELLNKF